MSTYAVPPPPLQQAINEVAQEDQVPPDLLVGIWHVESASHYPNPYKNPEGYGGLFGTVNWDASTLAQAQEAGNVLASTLRASGGNVADALYAYSGHGYTSVPGETTFGTIPVPGPPGPVTAAGTSSDNTTGTSQAASTTSSSLGSDFTGSFRELLLRLFELAAGGFLIYLGLKALAGALRSPVMAVRTVQGV